MSSEPDVISIDFPPLNIPLTFQSTEDILSVFRIIQGPYSIIIYDKRAKTLYFARDSLGRNSLLMGHHKGLFYLSSTNGQGLRNEVIELPPLGIYEFNVQSSLITLHPWTDEMLHVEYYQERINDIRDHLKLFDTQLNVIENAIMPNWLKTQIQLPSFRFDELMKDCPETDSFKICEFLLKVPDVTRKVDNFISLLKASVDERIKHTPTICTNCSLELSSVCHHPKIGILFSGGVDCTLLAVLADSLIDPKAALNLYNVAFEKVNTKETTEINWNVPDRLSAKEALLELKQINPDRAWNLVEINIPRKIVDEKLSSTVSDLVYPLTSVLDESLGGALWFAAGGGGQNKSPCRVLLIGSGADELLGGYTRHRNVFRRTGDVEEELLHDWHRLPSRNLARDDRVIADNGLTPRAPFVEERFVEFIRNLHPMEKCFHGIQEGLGDKLLLRLAAYKLGLKETATRRKRALQFGSRIADSRQNAKDKSQLLQ